MISIIIPLHMMAEMSWQDKHEIAYIHTYNTVKNNIGSFSSATYIVSND